MTISLSRPSKSLRAHVPTTALAKSAEVRDDMLWVTLTDGRLIAAPLLWFPILSRATPEQQSRYEILGNGIALHWPDIDEDLSIAGLLAGADSQSR